MVSVPDRAERVSTLELFFDLVFVFTITQLTGVLVAGGDAEAIARVVVVFALIWWMYDGYSWLTNAIATDRLRHRLLLVCGMGAFFVVALSIPRAFDGEGLAFALGYLAVVALHTGMYMRGASLAEAAAMLRVGAYNLAASALVLVGAAIGGDVEWVLWALATLVWLTPWVIRLEAFVISTAHFVERHGLVVIVALGESIVVIGAGTAAQDLDLALVVAALLALLLTFLLWWIYFSDEGAVERAFEAARPETRPRLAVVGFGYWHFGLLLGVIALAAGLKKGIGDPYGALDAWIAVELAGGVALFVASHAGFRMTLGIGRSGTRLVAAAAALATIPLGTEVAAAAQVVALAAILAAALVAERSPGRVRR